MTELKDIQNNPEYKKEEQNGTVKYIKEGKYIGVNSPVDNNNNRQLIPFVEHEVTVKNGVILSEQRFQKSPYEHGKWEKIVLQEKVNYKEGIESSREYNKYESGGKKYFTERWDYEQGIYKAWDYQKLKEQRDIEKAWSDEYKRRTEERKAQQENQKKIQEKKENPVTTKEEFANKIFQAQGKQVSKSPQGFIIIENDGRKEYLTPNMFNVMANVPSSANYQYSKSYQQQKQNNITKQSINRNNYATLTEAPKPSFTQKLESKFLNEPNNQFVSGLLLMGVEAKKTLGVDSALKVSKQAYSKLYQLTKNPSDFKNIYINTPENKALYEVVKNPKKTVSTISYDLGGYGQELMEKPYKVINIPILAFDIVQSASLLKSGVRKVSKIGNEFADSLILEDFNNKLLASELKITDKTYSFSAKNSFNIINEEGALLEGKQTQLYNKQIDYYNDKLLDNLEFKTSIDTSKQSSFAKKPRITEFESGKVEVNFDPETAVYYPEPKKDLSLQKDLLDFVPEKLNKDFNPVVSIYDEKTKLLEIKNYKGETILSIKRDNAPKKIYATTNPLTASLMEFGNYDINVNKGAFIDEVSNRFKPFNKKVGTGLNPNLKENNIKVIDNIQNKKNTQYPPLFSSDLNSKESIINKESNNIKNSQNSETNLAKIPFSASSPKIISGNIVSEIPKSRSVVIEKQAVGFFQEEIQKTNQVTKEDFMNFDIIEKTKTLSKVSNDLFKPKKQTPYNPRVFIPVLPTKTKNNFENKKESFKTFVRSKGVFREVGSFESPEKAFLKGIDIVSNSASASFKVEGNYNPSSFANRFLSPNQFRKSNIEKDVFIEKREKRIKSAGELQDITFKGQATIKGIFGKKKSKKRGIGFSLFGG